MRDDSLCAVAAVVAIALCDLASERCADKARVDFVGGRSWRLAVLLKAKSSGVLGVDVEPLSKCVGVITNSDQRVLRGTLVALSRTHDSP
jgi:hypothetical protein